jgi:hypothetical protein
VPRTTLSKPTQEDDMASTLTRAVLAELEQLREQVGQMRAVLAPAFARQSRQAAPRDPYAPRSWCGEGDCRPARPCPACQGAAPGQRSPAKTGDPWLGDYEHSPDFLDSARDAATPLTELRQRSAREDQILQKAAERAAGPSVLYFSPAWCGQGGCRPATPCPRCAGQVNRVMDKSGEVMGGLGQRTLVHSAVPELASEPDDRAHVPAGVGGWT